MSTDKCLYKEEVSKLNELLLMDFEMEHLRAVTYVLWAVHMTDSAAQDPHVASGVLLAMLTAARGMHCRPDQLACMKCVRWEQRRRGLQYYVYSSCAVCKLWV